MTDRPIDDEPNEDRNPDHGEGRRQRQPYDVGYGKPPLHSRFPPGRSGNPRGRTKGAKGLGAELKAELNERVSVTQDGKTRRLSKRRVIIKALAAKAAKGDVRAADKLLSLVIQAEGFEDQRSHRTELSENDLAILGTLLGGSDDPPEDGDHSSFCEGEGS